MKISTKKAPQSDEDWEVMYGEATDLFSPGWPIKEKDMLAGRSEQIAKLVDTVRQRGKHAIIYGERGVGKTSLSNTFALGLNSPTRRLLSVKVNADPTDTFASLWKKIFKRISITYLNDDKQVKRHISDDYEAEILPDDIQIELSAFSESHIVIITIDEFDRISDPNVGLLMADTIKALSDDALNCTIAIVGVSEDISKLITNHQSIARQLVQVQMPRMKREELENIIVNRVALLGMTIEDDVLWGIPYLSSGLPYYTHLLGMHTVRAAVKSKRMKITVEHFNLGMRNALDEIDQTMKEKYNQAVISRKPKETLFESVLLACALAEQDDLGRFQQKSVESPLTSILNGKRYKATTYAFHMNEFTTDKRGCVLEVIGEHNPRYKFNDPMMQPYVILKGLDSNKITGEIARRLIPQRQPQLFPIGTLPPS